MRYRSNHNKTRGKLVLCVSCILLTVLFFSFYPERSTSTDTKWNANGEQEYKAKPLPPDFTVQEQILHNYENLLVAPMGCKPIEFPHPIGIMSNRPAALSRLLLALKKVACAPLSSVYVWDDLKLTSQDTQVAKVIEDFGVHTIDTGKCGTRVTKAGKGSALTAKYWCLMDYLFTQTHFGQADVILIIEDDLLVAPDFLQFFSQVLPVMLKDPNAWCLSAWSDHSWPASVSDLTRVEKEQHLGGLGWALKYENWNNEIKGHKWDQSEDPWDRQLNAIMTQSKDRYCLYPQVSRTYHASLDTTDGDSQSRLVQDDILANIRLSNSSKTVFNIEPLVADAYDNQIIDDLMKGHIINCRQEALGWHNEVIILFIATKSDTDSKWTALGDHYANLGYLVRKHRPMRTIYKGIAKLRWGTNLLYILGEHSPFVSPIKEKLAGHRALDAEGIVKCASETYGDIGFWMSPYKGNFKAIASAPGESCTSACDSQGMQCDVHYFVHLNQELSRAKEEKHELPCERKMAIHPRLTWNVYPFKGEDKVWKGNMCQRWYSCDAAVRNIIRRCPCVSEN